MLQLQLLTQIKQIPVNLAPLAVLTHYLNIFAICCHMLAYHCLQDTADVWYQHLSIQIYFTKVG